MKYTLTDPNGNVLLAVESSPVVTEADMKADLDKAAKACESAFDEVTKYQDAMAVMSSEGFGEQVKVVASKAWEKIRQFIQALKEWFKKFKEFILGVYKKLTEKVKILADKLSGNDDLIVESIDVVDDASKSNESDIPDKKSTRVIKVKFKGKPFPIKLDYTDVKNVIFAKGYCNNLQYLNESEMKKVVSDYMGYMDADKDWNPENKKYKLVIPVSEVGDEEKYIKNTLILLYSGFKTLKSYGPNAICKPLVEAYASYDVKVQSKLDELTNDISTLENMENNPTAHNTVGDVSEHKKRIIDQLNKLNASKSAIDAIYTDVLKFNIKQTNIYDTVAAMTATLLKTLGRGLIHPLGTAGRGNYKRFELADGTEKRIYEDDEVEITEAEAKYFLKFTTAGKAVYSGFIHKIPTKDDEEAARKAVEIFARRDPKMALTSGKDVILYNFGYKVLKKSDDKYYLVLSGSVNLTPGTPGANTGHGDAKVKADLSGLTVLYHVQYNLDGSAPQPLTELNPGGTISKSEGHYYGGDGKSGRVYCSRYPVIRNGMRATKELLRKFNARVYEIKISDIDKDKVFIDPEHSTASIATNVLSKGRLENHCFYIETDKPVPVTEVTSAWV
jgi:hypothetical protein